MSLGAGLTEDQHNNPADQHINKDKALPRPRTMNRHRLPGGVKSGLSRSSVGCIMNTPWKGTPHEATATRNHRTLIASPLKLIGPYLLIDFGSWAAIRSTACDHGRLERCKTSGCLYQPLEKCMGLARAKRSLIPRRRNYLQSTAGPRRVSPRRVNGNILHSCSKKAFTWRNEVTGISVFDIVVACL
jgi:hypothetical protein